MRGRNVVLFIVILFLAGFGILFMMYETRKIDVHLGEVKTEAQTEELTNELNELDYMLYWIGELPIYMDGISEHVTLLTPDQATRNTLPVAEGATGFTAYDEDGNVISHIEQRDYAAHMMIVINTTDELSETTLEAIQDCAVDNHVPVLLIGRNNIDAFREYMILVHQNYDENSTMYFEISRYPADDPIDPEVVASGGHAYADALLEFIRSSLLNPAVVYVDRPAPETSAAYVTEDTSDAA